MSADTEKQQFYVTYRPDSLIYVMDKNMKPLRAFGLKGSNMNTGYQLFPSTQNIEKLTAHWQKEMQKRGYYTAIHVQPELNMVFRSYARGQHASQDGLQIYRGDTLWADVNVPAGFKVRGYSAPYVFSSVFVEEENDQLYVYRFNIQELPHK